MFKGLFKSAWKSDSPEKRLQYIDEVEVSDSSNQTILETLAKEDVDTSVRHAAMAKLASPQTLFELSQTHNDDKSRVFAENAFRQLIQSECNYTAADFNTFVRNNPTADLLIAKYCPLVEIRNELLNKLDEPLQANNIADIPYSNSRVMLAENIKTIESLEIARKNLKGKDKNAEKIIKAKIDAYHAQQKLELENATLATSIREQMEALARYVNWSDEIKVKFFDLKKTWDEFTFVPSAEEQRLYTSAFIKVEADVKHNMSIVLSQQNQSKIVASLETICQKIAAYSLDTLLTESTKINDELKDKQWQLSKESEIYPQTENIQQRFKQANDSIEYALKLSQAVSNLQKQQAVSEITNNHQTKLHQKANNLLDITKRSLWSDGFGVLNAENEANVIANDVLQITQQTRKEAQDALDKLHKRINRLYGLTKRGDVGRAQRELAAVNKTASHYEGKERKKLDDRIETLTVEVDKMGDWKDFAVEPKLIELCEQMERLPVQEKQAKTPSANNLAKKIKALQDQWKAMGSSDISESYWPRFKEAADIAYQPCAEFFEKRREIQQANLEKREPFITQMQELYDSTDWDAKPDYKGVEDKILQIMQSWKKVKDVEHGGGQKQWEKLCKVKDRINGKLDIEYDKNINTKQALITQLEQMSELEVNEKNTEQTLDKLKFTQNKWKLIGITRRNQDQKAWKKFKLASDAVYEKIQGVRQEKRAIEDEQIDAYKAIHKQIHQLAKTTQDLTVTDKEFEALKLQYKDLPPLPMGLSEKLIERLEKDYAKACDAYAGAKDRLNQAKLDNEIETLAKKAELCAELEQLPKKASDKAIKALEDKINDLELTNKDYKKRFAKRMKKSRDSDREEYAKARRLLLIDSEILLDIESPKEDKDMRLQIQLDRMKSQGIGNVAVDRASALEEMKTEWFCMPGAEAKVQEGFDKRFATISKPVKTSKK